MEKHARWHPPGAVSPVLDADLEAHKLHATDANVRAAIAKAFGADTVTGTGVNRKALASRVFANPRALRTLEDIVYPVLQGRLRESPRFRDGQNPPCAAFIEGAVLSNGRISALLDEIWIVEAPESVRLDRLLNAGSRVKTRSAGSACSAKTLPEKAGTTRIDNGGDGASRAAASDIGFRKSVTTFFPRA